MLVIHQLILLILKNQHIFFRWLPSLSKYLDLIQVSLANLRQTRSAIISVAKQKATKNSGKIKQYLEMLEDDSDPEEISNSEGEHDGRVHKYSFASCNTVT